ncbi:MAG: Major Facilitator Superfamily transporter [Acidimicrobiales bacterium]|nr:Major Facilitator Superfamily transporter [Acidimicrobiales bacterium]
MDGGAGAASTPTTRSPWFVLAVVLYGLFSVNVTFTILAISIPRIAQELHTSEPTMTWVVTGPVLAFGVIGPLVGKLGDRVGQRRVYLWGLFGAACMAALSAVAWNAPSLIAFRTLGAIEGAATGPASFAIISRIFPREQRVKALGFWSMIGAGAPVIGVVVGGPLVEAFGWRALYVGQVPLTLVGLFFAWRVLPETPKNRTGSFDVAGAGLVALAVTPLLFALSESARLGWSSPVVVASLVISPVALAAFVQVERRAAHPLLPLSYFGRRNFTFPILTQTFLNAAYMGSFILTPLLLQNVLHYSESHTGLVSIARPLAFSIAGPLAGFLAVRIGERSSSVMGAVAVVVALVWMSTLGFGSSDLVIMGALALAGVGMGTAMPSLASSITNAVDERDLGIAGAAQQMMTQVGIVFGIQVMQTVQQARRRHAGLTGSYHQAYLAGAAIAAVGLVTASFVRRIERHDPRPRAGTGGGGPAGEETPSLGVAGDVHGLPQLDEAPPRPPATVHD